MSHANRVPRVFESRFETSVVLRRDGEADDAAFVGEEKWDSAVEPDWEVG